MKKVALIFAILNLSLMAHAVQFRMIRKDISAANYEANLVYPILTTTSVPAFEKINAALLAKLESSGCDPKKAEVANSGMDYHAVTTLIALNKKYVGFVTAYDSFCNTPNPRVGTEYVTYNSITGEEIIMDDEIPAQKLDLESPHSLQKLQKHQRKLAAIMFKNIPFSDVKDLPDDCIEGETTAEYIESMAALSPSITGLAKKKQIVLKLNPPQEKAACEMSVRVSYKEISKFIDSDSILHQWLK